MVATTNRRVPEDPVSRRPFNERVARDDLRKLVHSSAVSSRKSCWPICVAAGSCAGANINNSWADRGKIIDAVSIRDRPAEIEVRAREGDLLSGSKNTHIATLVERSSRFVMLVKVNGKDSDSVVGALIRKVQNLPHGLMASLTWDL